MHKSLLIKPFEDLFLLFSLVFSSTFYVVAGYIDKTLCLLILQ